MTDEEWMQDRVTLRLAPWFDISVFKAEAVAFFEVYLEKAKDCNYRPEFIEDMEKYLDGERSLLPRVKSIQTAICELCVKIFPECDGDYHLHEALVHIGNRIISPEQWSSNRRL